MSISAYLFKYIDINPKELLAKGALAKKISMDKLQPFCRDVPEYEIAKFSGGTRFRNGDTIMARITPCLENGKTAMVNILEPGEVGFGSTEFIVFRAKEGYTDPQLCLLSREKLLCTRSSDKIYGWIIGSSACSNRCGAKSYCTLPKFIRTAQNCKHIKVT